MHRFLHNLIAIAVLMHAIIGCGNHHGCHAEETSDSHVVTHTHAGSTCPGEHKKHQHAPSQEAPEPNTPEPCGHCDCTCILADTDAVDFDSNNDFDYCVCLLGLTIDSSSLCTMRHRAAQPKHQPLWSGLRAHLAMSIQLV